MNKTAKQIEIIKPIKFSQCNCFVEPGKFKIDGISQDCQATWQLISRGYTVGVFQLENKLGQDWSSKVKPESIHELAALSALIRPGALESGMSQDYVDIKFGKKQALYLHNSLKSILEPTYGCMIYQEQALKIAIDIAGFSPENADHLRKAIGKKLPELMAKLKSRFIDGCKKVGFVDKEDAEKIFGWIEKSQRYSFNKSHSQSYAELSFTTAWLKCHFPQEFFTSYLAYSGYKQNPKEEICRLVQDARLFGVNVLLPDIKRKNIDFTMDKENNSIFFGLSHIKSVGKSAIKKIIDMSDGDLDTWQQFLAAVPILHRDVALSLIKSGACDGYNLPRVKMIDQLNTLLGYASRNEEGKKIEIRGITVKERDWFFNKLKQNISAVDILMKMSIQNKNIAFFKRMKKDELINFIEHSYKNLYTLEYLLKMKKDDLLSIIINKEKIETQDVMPKIIDKRRDILKEKAKFLLNNKDKTDSFRAKATAEKMFLGISLSCSAVDDCKIDEKTITCLEAMKLPNRAKFDVCGIIENVKHTKTKKGRNPGQPMCFVNFSDSTYAIDRAVLFPGPYAYFSDICKENQICIFRGVKKNGSFILEEIKKVI